MTKKFAVRLTIYPDGEWDIKYLDYKRPIYVADQLEIFVEKLFKKMAKKK